MFGKYCNITILFNILYGILCVCAVVHINHLPFRYAEIGSSFYDLKINRSVISAESSPTVSDIWL
jgi:hypothetical protein